MKKNKLTFLIATSFLALSAMVGCDSNEPSIESKAGVESNITTSELINPSSDGGNSQSSNGGNSNSSTSQGGGNTSQGGGNTSQGGGTSDKTDWTDAEKATMRGALHGLVLPFVNMEATVRTNNDGSSVKIESQQNMSGNFLASYAEKFTYEDGWNGGDVSYEFEVSNGNAFAYQKAVTENGKKYYVSVMFMGIEQTAGSEQINISKTGRFYLEASDPYEYEYPAAFIGQWLGQQFGTSIVPPAFDAEYYNLDSEGVLIGYSERNIEESYKSALLSSGNFTIDSARNDDGYLIARPTDGSYIMLFKYDSTNKIMILQVMENTGWNTPQINSFFIKYNKRPFDIPAFSDDNVTFKFEEVAGQPAGYEKAIITIGRVTTQKVQAYVNSLKAAGYVLIDDVVTDNYQWYSSAQILTDDGVCSLDLMYYPTSSPKKLEITINLFIDTSRVKAWPAAQMAAIAQASQDIVPAFTGFNNGFYVGDQGATVYVDLGEETNARDSYISALTTAKYTLVDGHYISQHNEIDIEIVCNANKWPGQIYIIVKPYTAPEVTQWPAADISAAIVNNLSDSFTDSVPELDVGNANECTVGTSYTGTFDIYIEGGDLTVDAVKTALKNAGWREDIYYIFTNGINGGFISPNKQMVVQISAAGESIALNFYSYAAQEFAVVGIGDVWDYHYSPIAFEPATDAEEVAEGKYRIQTKATFDVVYGDKFKVTDGFDWFGIETVEDAVSAEDFAYDEYENIVALKDGKVDLYFKTMADGSKKIYIAYVSETPVQEPVYKLVGSFSNWSYEDENSDELLKNDSPEEGYLAQYSIYFEIFAGEEFKIYDGSGDSGWIGGEVFQANEWFEVLSGGNIKAKQDGLVDLAFDILSDGTKKITINDFEPEFEDGTWAKARYEALQNNPDAYIPNLEIEGASGYTFDSDNNSIDVTLSEGVVLTDVFDSLLATLDVAGFHFSVRFGGFVNVDTNAILGIGLNGNNSISIYPGTYDFADDEGGYGLLILAYDDVENCYYLLDESNIGIVNPSNAQEYMVTVDFVEGTAFVIYDFSVETQLEVGVDEASIGGEYENYFQYDMNENVYVVKQDFTATIYIKLIQGADVIYVELVSNP